MFDVKAYTVGVSTQRKGMVDLRRAVLSTNSQALLCTMFTCTLLWFHKSCCSFNANNEATCDLWIKSATVASLLNTKNSSDPCHHLERGKLISTSEMQLPRGKYWAAVTAAKSTSQTSNTSRKKTETQTHILSKHRISHTSWDEGFAGLSRFMNPLLQWKQMSLAECK